MFKSVYAVHAQHRQSFVAECDFILQDGLLDEVFVGEPFVPAACQSICPALAQRILPGALDHGSMKDLPGSSAERRRRDDHQFGCMLGG